MFLFCLVFAMFCARLFICASWSPAGKGLTSWLSFVVSSVSLSLSHWYPGSGVVLDCIDSWSLQPYLLSITDFHVVKHFVRNNESLHTIPPPGGIKFYFFVGQTECLNICFSSIISNVYDQNTNLTPFLCKFPNSLSSVSCTQKEIYLPKP